MGETTTRVKQWSNRLTDSRHGLVLIFIASFLETIIVPIPIEVVLIPYMLKERHRVWLIATVTLLGCMVAATLGYYVGATLFDTLGVWLLETLRYTAEFESFQQTFNANGFLAILMLGVVPIPFQVAMLVAGAAGYPLPLFWLAATLARGVRYYGLAGLVILFGNQTLTLWNRFSNRAAVTLLMVAALVYILIKWV